MKRMVSLLLAFVLCLSLSACKSTGTINNVEVDYGSSVSFSDAEIESAFEAVIIIFKDFEGCDLRRLWYDEERSNRIIQNDISTSGGNTIKNSGAAPENIIILFSDFYVAAIGADLGFSPDSTYTDWNWILIRDGKKDKWEVVGWGY